MFQAIRTKYEDRGSSAASLKACRCIQRRQRLEPTEAACHYRPGAIHGHGDRISPNSHCQPGRIRPENGTDARLRAPGRGRTAARHPIGVVRRVVRGQAGSPYGHPSSWRAADDSLCLVGNLRSPLGREGRIRCARESRRFHPRACLPTAHGDQSVGFGALSLGGREEHLNADRGELPDHTWP
jgi:hypothetical protein